MPIEDDASIQLILKTSRTIALVGASENPNRDSNRIMQFLMDRGYDVHPVNPQYENVLGRKCFPDLASVPVQIDIVDVFRNPEAVPAIVDEAIAVKAKALWLQFGVVHPKAARKAEKNGLPVIMDHCIAVDHRRLI
ncbi:MAG: CoA-binding protein [Bacteroidota bacterium]